MKNKDILGIVDKSRSIREDINYLIETWDSSEPIDLKNPYHPFTSVLYDIRGKAERIESIILAS